ncbi:hypothetical protein RHGRI_001043 [Rhododendron griersonianum]|uniref:Uncharacterized protein n=1 Tax=Rhododendron griersonianum TaxID=479676 RepID=A0AAV6LLW7_9ERIC|nr:hypothetical protein RHGRI_001043 [Rhododendron griersonianum]
MSVMKSLLLLIQTQKQHPFKKRFGCRVGASQFYYPGNSTSWGEREEAACGMHHFTDSYMSSVSNFIRNYLKVFAGFLFAPMNFCKTFGSLSNSRPAFETINLRGHVNSNKNGST